MTTTAQPATAQPATTLSEKDAKALLKQYDIPLPPETAAPGADAAAAAAEAMGFPVALKAYGAALTHKTERGLVRLHIADAAALKAAAEEMAARAGADLEGFLVTPMMAGAREFIAGMFRDPLFGPVITFGMGGVMAEAMADVAPRLSPLTEADARDMLDGSRAGALLGAFRGEAPADRAELIRTLMALSRIAQEHPEIAEIDINPLRALPDGSIVALDALVVTAPPAGPGDFPPPVDPKHLGRLFHPRSIAFIGASAQMGKWGHILPAITLSSGFAGEVHLVNPRGGAIAGRPVFKSVGEIPGPVDLAVITIPAEKVMDLIPELSAKGIASLLLITSGFSETGEAGRRLERELVERLREAGIVMVGPNTMGICNPHIGLFMTGSHVWPRAGSTVVVAQSGNMGTQLLGFAEQQGIGIRGFAGSGNEGMVAIEDFMEAFETDDLTRIVMLYIESVKNGRRFFESARRISRNKPIVLMKGGRSAAGNRAAASHTGAMATDARIFDAMCRQAGIVQVSHPMDLLDLAGALSALPLPSGRRVAIMTLGGGWGVVTADLCADSGLTVPPLPPEIVSRLDRILPPYWSRSNPVDIVGENDESLPAPILEELLRWEGCDAVINLGIIGRRNLLGRYIKSISKADPTYSADFLDSLGGRIRDFEKRFIEKTVELMEQYRKPVIGVSILTTDDDQTLYRVDGSRLKGVYFPTPERAVKALAKMSDYQCFRARC